MIPCELCRISVHGPAGRADLAVPVTSTVASLLPVLLQHTSDEHTADEHPPDTEWVLQRLGGPAMDPGGTPETLSWLEGERLSLRPAGDTLPELAFDDVADGIATSVGDQPGRWRPEHLRPLFLGVGALIAPAMLWLASSPAIAGAAAAVFLVAAIAIGRVADDAALGAVLGLSGCLLAFAAGVVAVDGALGAPALFSPSADAATAGAGAAFTAAGLLLAARPIGARGLPMVPFGIVAGSAAALALGVLVHQEAEISPGAAAAVVGVVWFGLTIAAPRVVIRAAHLLGPQLPRTAADMRVDIEPAPAADVRAATARADNYLTVIVAVTAAVLGVTALLLVDEPGWAPPIIIALFAVSMLLRAREFLGVAQRAAMVAAGAYGLLVPAVQPMGTLPRVLVVTGLAAVAAVSVFAVLRPVTRRLRPMWGHVANIVETLAALAIVPVLLQVLGVYAWARGLGG